MKRFNLILFIFGTLLEIVGFLLVNADNYTYVLRLVSPAYVNGMKGIKTLESGKDLTPSMIGFKEIAIPLANRLINDQTGEKLAGIEVVKINRPLSISQEFRTSGVKTVRKITAEGRGGTPIDTTMETLTKNVMKLKTKNLKWKSLTLFIIGLALSFLSFIIDRKKA